uniref:Uncharacterized protein n=1 Tax=Siphoviridae sp. ctixZ6 TaxID=2826437 RepID=A0A8S5N8T4_9CAUD|nr:MAG TPA: hypothetical protein [Siphoviridae sp. ctixZ6]
MAFDRVITIAVYTVFLSPHIERIHSNEGD